MTEIFYQLIKPCPFCGCDDASPVHGEPGVVRCFGDCDAEMHGDSDEDAIEKWNRRATPTPDEGAAA